jgi:hypothetical protein
MSKTGIKLAQVQSEGDVLVVRGDSVELWQMHSWYAILWIARSMYQILLTLIPYTNYICDLAISLTMLSNHWLQSPNPALH